MSSSEGELVYTMGQVNREAVGILSAVSEMSRLTLPGDPAPPTAVRLTQDRPPREQRRRRARYEGLPLHASQPAVPDVTIPLQPLPPRPPGMFYAPGYPTGPSQMYWWPPVQGFQGSQYPPWPTPQGGFPSAPYGFTPASSSSQPFGFSPAGTSTHQMAGLDSITQDYRPQFDATVFPSPQSFSTSFMQSPHTGPIGAISTQDINAAMGVPPDDPDDDEDDDEDEDQDDIPRRNPTRVARYTCDLSPFEHDQRRCRGYHERRE